MAELPDICYGTCQQCGQRICRPANYSQRGMHCAKVCDDCWFEAAASYQMGVVSTYYIAKEFGVHQKAVWRRFARLGVTRAGPEAYRAANNRYSKRAWQDQTGTKTREYMAQANHRFNERMESLRNV